MYILLHYILCIIYVMYMYMYMYMYCALGMAHYVGGGQVTR